MSGPRRTVEFLAAGTLAALALFVSSACLVGCAGKRPPAGPFQWRPAAAGGVALEDPVIRVQQDGFQLELERLEDNARWAFLAQRGIESDPLAGLPSAGGLLTFRLALRAPATAPLHLETQSIRLWANEGQASTAPLDFTRAFELLRPRMGEAPPDGAVEALMKGMFEATLNLPPGTKREGLLVFPAPAGTYDAMILELPFVQVGAETRRLQLPFVKHYPAAAALRGPAR